MENSKLSNQSEARSSITKGLENSELNRKYLQDRSNYDNSKTGIKDCNGVLNKTLARTGDSSLTYREPTFQFKKKVTVYPPAELIDTLKSGKKIVMEDTRNEFKIKGLLKQQLVLELDQSKREDEEKIHERKRVSH